MSWKHFWCSHIWGNIGSVRKLRTVRERDGQTIGNYYTYTYYAQEQECVKCKKTHTIETRKIHL